MTNKQTRKWKLLFLLFFSFIILKAQSNDSVELRIISSTTIHFAFGKAELPEHTDSILAPVLELVEASPQILIDISAHTDAIGADAANVKLSLRRADSVQHYLVKNGIADSLLTINTHGEKQPVAENNSEQGRQQNRRAVVQVFEKFRSTLISGKVRDKETNEGIQADIIIHGKVFRDSFKTDSTGNWERRVPANEVLGIDVFAPNYFYETTMIKTTIGKNKLVEVEIPFVRPGMAIPIKHLYFVGGSSRFLPRSEVELPKLLKFLLYNDSIRVEIAGHVNVPWSKPGFASQEEFNLSVRRAKAVYDYLIDHYIRSERLSFKGYGNSEMRFPRNPTAKQQQLNRRVEIKVLGTNKVISTEDQLKQ